MAVLGRDAVTRTLLYRRFDAIKFRALNALSPQTSARASPKGDDERCELCPTTWRPKAPSPIGTSRSISYPCPDVRQPGGASQQATPRVR